jgi:cytoskeletal protein RodZ
MADIGATLREARMRQRIDITDMEVRTKIRAKYLRALENEEWDLLPGPTYVRSFLRTYAEALGLDAKMIVEEYKLRHEPTEAGELHPIRRPTQRERATRRGGPSRRRGLPRGALVGLVLAAIVVALFFVGRTGDEDEPTTSTVPTMPSDRETEAREEPRERPQRQRPARSRTVRLQLVPTGPVSVCLVNAAGKVLIGNEILQPGRSSRTFRSRRFRMVLGNNAVRMRINGKIRQVPASGEPIGYDLTRSGRRPLAADRRPTCT